MIDGVGKEVGTEGLLDTSEQASALVSTER